MHVSPDGVELEWHAKMHVARQKTGESVLEFAGRLRILADKGYPSWSPESRVAEGQSGLPGRPARPDI